MSWRWPCLMLSGGGVSNYYVVSVGGREYVKGRRYMFLPWRHTQCHGEVRPGGAAKAGTAHESGLGRRRRRRGHLRRRRVGHERLEGVELLLLRRRRRRLAPRVPQNCEQNKPIIILKERQVTRPAPRRPASPALQKKPVRARRPSNPREGAAPPGQSIR